MRLLSPFALFRNLSFTSGLLSRHVAVAGLLLLLAGSSSAAVATPTISPLKATSCGGKAVEFNLSGLGDIDATTVTWNDVFAPGAKDSGSDAEGEFKNQSGASNTYTPPDVDSLTIITITAKLTNGVKVPATLIVDPKPCPAHYGGEMLRTVVSYEQIGAAGTDSTQKWAFDFFISRPVPLFDVTKRIPGFRDEDPTFGPRFRWWGNIGLGSYPQQVNSEILTFASDFAANAGKLKVNQLVQTAQFVTGPELRLSSTRDAHRTISDSSWQKFSWNYFAGIGAIGPFSPGENATVFQVPATNTPQYAALCKQFPDQFCPGNVTPAASPSQTVAFVPQTNSRFGREWQYAGLRLYTMYADPQPDGELLNTPPATVEFSLGHSDIVNRDHRAVIGFASGYYPFALGDRRSKDTVILYLFGEANLAITHPKPKLNSVPRDPNNPIFLSPAKDAGGNAIPLTDPNVLIITVTPNQRDTYRIGAGLDLLTIFNRLKNSGNKNDTNK